MSFLYVCRHFFHPPYLYFISLFFTFFSLEYIFEILYFFLIYSICLYIHYPSITSYIPLLLPLHLSLILPSIYISPLAIHISFPLPLFLTDLSNCLSRSTLVHIATIYLYTCFISSSPPLLSYFFPSHFPKL